MGDATNFVLMVAGELLKKAESLLLMGLHPSEVIQGYELARTKALEELESSSLTVYVCLWRLITNPFFLELSSHTLPKSLTIAALKTALKPAIASKQYGSEDALASLVAEAALAVMPKNPVNFNVDSVRVVKIMGGGLHSSRVVKGMVFGREPEGVPESFPSSGYLA